MANDRYEMEENEVKGKEISEKGTGLSKASMFFAVLCGAAIGILIVLYEINCGGRLLPTLAAEKEFLAEAELYKTAARVIAGLCAIPIALGAIGTLVQLIQAAKGYKMSAAVKWGIIGLIVSVAVLVFALNMVDDFGAIETRYY